MAIPPYKNTLLHTKDESKPQLLWKEEKWQEKLLT